MKKILPLLSFIFLTFLCSVSMYGQNIIIVSDDAAASQTYSDDLTALNYSVVIRTDLAVELSSDQIDELNAADLIIISRNTNSANYNFPDIWNDIETPILLSSCFLTRNSRLNWLNSAEQNEADGIDINVVDNMHPIFEGIDVSSGTLNINVTLPLHTNPVTGAGNGTVLATSVTTGNVVIAEWPKDTEFYDGAGYYATEFRAIFFTGLGYDFTGDGKMLFLNMVNYILNPPEEVAVQNNFNKNINIYPNPVESTLKFSGDISSHSTYKIISLSGQTLISKGLQINTEIDVSNLSPGLYILKIVGDNTIITHSMLKK